MLWLRRDSAYVVGMGGLACVVLASGVLLGVLSLVAWTGARQAEPSQTWGAFRVGKGHGTFGELSVWRLRLVCVRKAHTIVGVGSGMESCRAACNYLWCWVMLRA